MSVVVAVVGGTSLLSWLFSFFTTPVRPVNECPEDATAVIQRALDSGAAEVVLSHEGSPWRVGPVFVRSNTHLVLEAGTELVAKSNAFQGVRERLLTVSQAENVTISGGVGSAIRMRREDYRKPPYTPSEWRHAIYVSNSTNVVVEGLDIVDSGGDGLCAGGKTKGLTVRDCDCNRNHRQGISICTAEDVLIERCRLRNTRGTAPQAGIDFEPNQDGDCIVNCVMRDCEIENNHGQAIEVNLTRLNGRSRPVSLTVENCRTVGGASSFRIRCGKRASDFVKGFVRFRNCSFKAPRDRVFWLGDCPGSDFTVSFDACMVTDVPKGPNLVWFESGVLDQPPPDGFDFGRMMVKDAVDEPWFFYRNPGVAPAATRFAGEFVFESLGGRPQTVTMDNAWAAANLPPVNGGKPLPARLSLPKNPTAHELDGDGSLAPIVFGGRALGIPVLFHVPQPGDVRFTVRRIGAKGALPKKSYALYWLDADGRRHGVKKIAVTGDSQEIVYRMPRRGYCLFETPWRGGRFVLEKANAEPAFDVRRGALSFAPEKGRTMELGFDRTPGEALLFVDTPQANPCAVEVADAAGRFVLSQTVSGRTLLSLPEGTGRWCVRVTGKKSPPSVHLDLYGTTPLFYIPVSRR